MVRHPLSGGKGGGGYVSGQCQIEAAIEFALEDVGTARKGMLL